MCYDLSVLEHQLIQVNPTLDGASGKFKPQTALHTFKKTMGWSQVFSMKSCWKYAEQAERIILWHLTDAPSQAMVTSQNASVCKEGMHM